MLDTELWGRDPRFADGSGAGSPMMERVLAQLASRPPINMAPVDEAHRRLKTRQWRVSFDLLLDVTSYTFQVPRSRILGPSREVPLPRARQALVWVAREVTNWGYPALGELLARDHSTMIVARRRGCNLRETDADFRALTDAMLLALEPHCAAKSGMETDHAG
jgi:chromosomal replication initiation ATPase DnaA